jgi:hypothetical protein
MKALIPPGKPVGEAVRPTLGDVGNQSPNERGELEGMTAASGGNHQPFPLSGKDVGTRFEVERCLSPAAVGAQEWGHGCRGSRQGNPYLSPAYGNRGGPC